MARTITLMLNQQQQALLDRAIAQGVASDLADLVKLAIRELASRRKEGSK